MSALNGWYFFWGLFALYVLNITGVNPLRWYRDRQRKIFRFYNGRESVGIDPIQKYREIMTHPKFDSKTHGPAFDRGEPEAFKIVMQCARDVFEVPEYTKIGQKGMTEFELTMTFKRFLNYCEELKKSIEESRTTQPPTPEQEAPAGSTDYVLPTNVSAALSSTEKEFVSSLPGCC